MRYAPRRPRGVVPGLCLSLCLMLGLTACGGGSGGGGGGLPPGGNNPPTGTLIAPTLGIAGLLGDSFRLSFVSDDDGTATVRFVADQDWDLNTTADQVVLFTGQDGNGAQQDATLTLQAPLALGTYSLFLEVDDGVNPAVVIELPQALVIHPALAGVAPPRSNRYGVIDRTVVFSRGEAEDNTGPLNGDGLADDGVAVVYDTLTGLLTQPTPSISMDVTGAPGGRARPLLGESGTLAWLTLEADENFNLNGGNFQNPVPPFIGADIDAIDAMVSFFTPAVSPVPITNTYGSATALLGVAGGRILAQYAEAGEGVGGTMLNGDGDALDVFFGYVDPLAPVPPYEFNQVVLHTGFPGGALGLAFQHAQGTNVGWLATELTGPFLFNANGDLDQGDTFLALGTLQQPGGTGLPAIFSNAAGFQAAPPKPPSPVDPAAGFGVTVDGHAGYYISEITDNGPPGGIFGNDLNGDGLIGMTAAFYDITNMLEFIPAGAAGPVNSAPGSPLVYDGTRMFFTGIEAPRADPALGTNGDGDGGADLNILYWTDHSVPGPISTPVAVNFGGGITLTGLSLDLGGSMVSLAPGWMAVIVNELANGGQDINGSGAVDMAYLLIETAALPAPVVHNPGFAPSFTQTFPLTGLYGEDPGAGDQGVVVRLTELMNGDLDADANATETFFAYVSFQTPTTFLLLDGGGDHCAVAPGLIGITAKEDYTGRDYDGNGQFTDAVFRVFDFSGTAVQPGLPCARRSVPVTDTGNLWAYLRDEVTENRNLNGDGDSTDLILGLWIP